MVRVEDKIGDITWSSPHPRGDGPASGKELLCLAKFSPPTWGWSGFRDNEASLWKVLPTHVGMVRK